MLHRIILKNIDLYGGGKRVLNRGYLVSLGRCSEYFSPLPPGNPNKPLFETIMRGHAHDLRHMLETKTVNVNLRFEQLRNCTPLMLAAEYNKVDMMHELIDHGADLNLQDDFGDTALMIAAREKNKEASDLLVEAGAQLDILNYEQMTAADATLDVEIDEKIRSDVNHPHPEREGKPKR